MQYIKKKDSYRWIVPCPLKKLADIHVPDLSNFHSDCILPKTHAHGSCLHRTGPVPERLDLSAVSSAISDVYRKQLLFDVSPCSCRSSPYLHTEVGFRSYYDSDLFRAPYLKAVEWTLYRIITLYILPVPEASREVWGGDSPSTVRVPCVISQETNCGC